MLLIPGFKGLRKILWKDISPGMILIGGVKVNNGLPLEVARYPVLTFSLVQDLTQKYHFKPTKEVIVAETNRGESPTKMSVGFSTIEKRISAFNNLRSHYFNKRANLLPLQTEKEKSLKLIFNPNLIDSSFYRTGNYNSSDVRVRGAKLPSILNNPSQIINITDVLTGRIKTLNLPKEKETLLHIGIGYTKEMNEKPFISEINNLLSSFIEKWKDVFLDLRIIIYVFSTECEVFKFPLTGKEMERGDIIYSSFYKKVMHNRNKEILNKVFLFTAREPIDLDNSILTGFKMKKLGIDYTHIVLDSNLSDEKKQIIYKSIVDTTDASGGNLFIPKVHELTELITIEAFDNYLGNISLGSSSFQEAIFTELKPPVKIFNSTGVDEKKKIVKPFEFKRIEKKEI